MKKSKTREELLVNTCKFFNLNNRGISDSTCDTCAYITDDGKRCAIGREVSLKTAFQLEREGGDAECVAHLLPKRLQSMGDQFLNEVQFLHDKEVNWTAKGLSRQGVAHAFRIVKNFNLNLTIKDLK